MVSVRSILLILILSCCSGLINGQTIDPNAKPFQINGTLGANVNYNYISGIQPRRQPYGYGVFASINIKLYGWSLPFSVAISQQGTTLSQPFSRYGISPQYKWVKLHLGYRNMRFSEFTLGGITFLGGGVELTPGKFRFSAMYGRLRKAVEKPKNQFEAPQFQRKGFGFKIGVGDKTFIDLSFFSAKDILGSLQFPDSLELRNLPEASNSLGLTGKFSMVKDQLNLDYDVAVSTFTHDLRVDSIKSSDNNVTNAAGILNLNSSSNAALAGSAGLQYKNNFFTAGLKYRYVQSGYRTLGTNYLLSDVEMITINAGTSIIKNRMAINASYGIQNNNLSEHKFAKTGKNIGSANINYRATDKLNFNLSYSNFSIYQTLIKDTLFADSVVVDQTNHLLNFAGTYIVANKEHTHSIALNSSFQELADQREGFSQDAGNQLISIILTYGIRFNAKKYGFTFGINYQDFSSFLTTQKRYGGNVGFNMQLLERKLNLRIKQIWNRSVLTDRNDDIFNTRLTLNYALNKKNILTLTGGYISRIGLNDFREVTIGLGYRMRF